MLMRRTSIAFCLTFALSFAGCSDDSGTPTPTPDQGQKDQSTTDGQASQQDGQQQQDSTLSPDSAPAICEKECTDFLDYLCVKDPTTTKCEGCLEDKHCTGNPRADGPFCDTTAKLCVCKVDTDCAAATTGKKCLQVGNFKSCTCESDTDCPAPYTICEGSLIKRCVKPCASSADCKRGGVTGTCDTATGKCSFPEV